MTPGIANISMKSLTSAALFCVFTLGTVTSAFSQGPPNAATNPYAAAGEEFLLQLQLSFLQSTPPPSPPGFTLPLYSDNINPNDGTKSTQKAFLFTQENMIRALYWGTQVDPADFQSLLSTSVDQLAWNYGDCGAGIGIGFGTTRNATCFFDDNAQLGGTLMDVYLHALPSSTVYADSSAATNYVLRNTDAQGGIPQVPANLGQGNFYMNPVVESGQAEVNYGTVFNNSDAVAIGLRYFNEVNDPALGLINKNGLFIGGTQFVNGQWVPNKVGALPGESVNVSLLALALYRNARDPQYLQYAENLANLVIAKWVAPSGAVSANAVNGGYAIVNLLCQLYQTDHNETYYYTAKSIIDFLLNNTRDQAGYFPNGTGTAGNWNNIRTGQAPDATTTLLTQSAAAAAILEFAYVDLNHNAPSNAVNLQTSMVLGRTSTGYEETVTVTNKGASVASSVLITSATLGSVTGMTLPVLLGDLQPNQAATFTLTFPTSVGADHAATIERVLGTYSGGTFGGALRATLP